MSANIYELSRDVFLDVVDSREYVQFDRISGIYSSLIESIKKPLKMVLIYGEPGTGKSMLLSRLYDNFSANYKVSLYSTPILDEGEFYKLLAQDIFDMRYDDELNFTQFMKVVKSKEGELESTPIVMLDEAQLYPEVLMEKIRLISDTRVIKFVIVLHKTQKEDLIAKEHFQTRIWESYLLENTSSAELKLYIQKKLMKSNLLDVAAMFSKKSVELIHKLTQGNLRDTNKLLYTLFEIYMFYSINKPRVINQKEISRDIIEMAAIHTGFLNA
ncbi:MAG: ATP-binding protein [Sulfurimonadaceae bacterium]|nr:ATP-binding protein [Sulfurimonadaceae bacterium]